jgi:Ca2+-binding RTX toxin-like protein
MLNNHYLELLKAQLAKLATQANFETILTTSFGSKIDLSKVSILRQQWLHGDFSLIPPIDILSHGELGNANGGYAASEDKIFVSSDLITQNQNNSNAITGLLLEEFGHKLDRFFNGNIDSAGDEGEIFSRLISGQTLSSATLARLKAEDDTAVIIVDGRVVSIEQQIINGDYLGNLLEGDVNGVIEDDQIYGYGGNDEIYGYGGNDEIYGDAGDDKLSGGDDDDTLYGGDGNDKLSGDAGNDYLSGGAGNDDLVGDAGDDDLVGDAGDDKLSGGAGTDYLSGKDGDDSLDGGDGNDLLDGQSGDDSLVGGNGDDELDGGDGADSLVGGTGDDTLYGGSSRDYLNGGEGNDYLYGGDGSDTLDGGLGADIMLGDRGNDNYIVDNVGDIVSENIYDGIDTVKSSVSYTLGAYLEHLTLTGTTNINGTGNSLNNIITGNSGINILTGGAGNDTINAGDGSDFLNGGVGNDTLSGSGGNDTYVIDADVDFGTDTISDTGYFLGSLQDLLDFRTTTKAVNVNLGTSAVQTIAAGVQLVLLGGVEGVYGGAGNDTLTGNSSSNYLSGGAGNDTLNGNNGNDGYVIDADIDLGTDIINDVISSSLDANYLDFRTTTTKAINVDLAVTTTQTVATGVQLVIPVISITSAYGGTQNDTLKGNSLNNSLSGGAGNDSFLFKAGVPLTGANTVASLLGQDIITDFVKNQDKILLSKNTFAAITSGVGVSLGTNFATVANDTLAGGSAASIVYSQQTGNLFYNQNGIAAGYGNGGNFAGVSGLPALAVSDFSIVA